MAAIAPSKDRGLDLNLADEDFDVTHSGPGRHLYGEDHDGAIAEKRLGKVQDGFRTARASRS